MISNQSAIMQQQDLKVQLCTNGCFRLATHPLLTCCQTCKGDVKHFHTVLCTDEDKCKTGNIEILLTANPYHISVCFLHKIKIRLLKQMIEAVRKTCQVEGKAVLKLKGMWGKNSALVDSCELKSLKDEKGQDCDLGVTTEFVKLQDELFNSIYNFLQQNNSVNLIDTKRSRQANVPLGGTMTGKPPPHIDIAGDQQVLQKYMDQVNVCGFTVKFIN